MSAAQPGSIADTHGTKGFGLNNLPYGSFDPGTGFRPGVRIGDSVIDLPAVLAGHPRVSDALVAALDTPSLDGLLAAGHLVWA